MIALFCQSLFAAGGNSLLYLQRGGGLGGAFFVLVLGRLFRKRAPVTLESAGVAKIYQPASGGTRCL